MMDKVPEPWTSEYKVWVAVSAAGDVIGAWPDQFVAKHAAMVFEEEQKVECRVVAGTLLYED